MAGFFHCVLKQLIMLKKLVLAAFAATSIATFAAPAQAGTCWYINNGRTVSGEYCYTNRRINYNGHVVFDIIDAEGKKFTVVLWDDNVAEVIGLTSRPQQVRTYTDSDGDIRLVWPDGYEFSFVHH